MRIGRVSGFIRVLRGGNWFGASHSARVTVRFNADMSLRDSGLGVRLARRAP